MREPFRGSGRIPFVENAAVFESTYAPAGRAAEFAGELERARRYARWGLRSTERPMDAADAVAERFLRRGALIPAPRALERPLGRLLGDRLQAGLRAVHQLQLAALRAGAERPRHDLHELGVFSWEEAEALAALAYGDLARLRRACRALYPGEEPESGPVFVSFTGREPGGWDCVFVEEGGDGEPAPLPQPQERARARPCAPALRALLRRAFGHSDFRPGQRDAIEALLAGRDAAALLPTGGGKSLIFQLAALAAPGTAVVVAPLLALIDDQRRALARLGVTAVGGAEELDALAEGRLLLVYASPERFETAAFRAALRAAAERGVSFVAVDEAHCVTPWGHDFRPALLSVGKRARRWATGPAGDPALAALTGTASRAELACAAEALRLFDPVVVQRPLERAELALEVERCGPGEHVPRLRAWIAREGRFGPGLVFCPSVDGTLGASGVCETLTLGENVQAGCFTGRAPAGREPRLWTSEKTGQAEAFLAGRLDWLCCTSAFGMGVDVPAARWTVHLGLADSHEGFLQQSGRAGRDGGPATARVLLHLHDEARARRWLSPECEWEDVWAERQACPPRRRDDAWAALARHRRGFPGADVERVDAAVVARALGPLRRGAVTRLSLPGQAEGPMLRSLSRMEAAGVLEVWRRSPGAVEVLGTSDAGVPRLIEAAGAETARVYAVIERARRASLGRLLDEWLSASA